MQFRSYTPRAPLCEFIDDFWLYEDYAADHPWERILPSGTFEMVFNLREDELRIYGSPDPNDCRRFAGALISGPYSGSFTSDAAEEAALLGVHFKPGGAFAVQVFSRVPDARVTAASPAGRDIEADGLVFSGLADLAKVDACEVICVPGGLGTPGAIADESYMRQIRRLASGAKYLTSVCTGSLILAAAGLLRGRRAACHWAWRELLEPFGAIVDDGRVVRDGNILTGGGVTAGIDLALVAVAEIFGVATAQSVQLVLEYAPAPPFDAGRPERAPAEVTAQVHRGMAAMLKRHRKAIDEAASRLQPS